MPRTRVDVRRAASGLVAGHCIASLHPRILSQTKESILRRTTRHHTHCTQLRLDASAPPHHNAPGGINFNILLRTIVGVHAIATHSSDAL